MNNDLISREALKKAINDNGCRHSHYFDIFDIIDNAPTVHDTINLYPSGKVIIQQTKPQGEWIKHSTYKDVLICSNCNHGSNQVYDTFNFCPNCGAKMKNNTKQ